MVFLYSVVVWFKTIFLNERLNDTTIVIALDVLLLFSDDEKPKVYPALPHLVALKYKF